MKLFSRDVDAPTPGWRRRLTDLPAAVRWGAAAALVLSAILLGWLGVNAMNAKSQLEQARTSAQQMKNALLDGQAEAAVRHAENAQFHARQASAATHSLPWNVAAAIPMVGSPFKTTQQISDVVVGLANDVLLPAASMGDAVTPDRLINGTRLNLDLLRAEQPRLTDLAGAAAKLNSQAQAISQPAYLSPIVDARSQLQDQTTQLAELLQNTSLTAQLAPSMLGADGPRTYLMAFQTPAEARATGGVLGAFGLIRFEDGAPMVDTLASNNYLRKSLAAEDNAEADIDLGPEFNRNYGWMNPYTDLRNSNVSAHFPYAAQIWKSMWETSMWGRQDRSRIDGVIALDIVSLSYILGALGPVTLPDGEVITQSNVVELTGSTVYMRFPLEDQVEARKEFLQTVAREVIKKATTQAPSPRRILEALGRAAGEGRISVWSALPAEQQLLEQTPLAHIVPDGPSPYLQVVINNLAGNKMDYYLKREVEYVADDCDGDTRNSTVTVRLTNTATPDMRLPDYYAGTPGLAEEIPLRVPTGTMVTAVSVIATKGATLLSVTSNGEKTTAVKNTERGHPAFDVQVAIPPGHSGELTFRLSEPTAPGEPQVAVQPLVDNPKPHVAVPACGG